MLDEVGTDKSFNDGFNSGLNWPDAWMNHGKPGGPWIPSAGYDDKSRAANTLARAENKAWCAGWETGLAEKISTNRINPFSDTDKNAQYHTNKGPIKMGMKMGMPTILESLETALETLEDRGYRKGGAIYDDLVQAIAQLKNGDSVDSTLEE